MKKFRNTMLLLCVMCLLVGVAVLSAGCQKDPEPTTTAPSKVVNANYTVTVRTAGGMELKDVTVYVYQDNSKTELVDVPKKLDKQGQYSFIAPVSDQYVVMLQGVPAGYDVQEQYQLTSTQMDILLTSAPIAGQAPSNLTYEPGDIIYDYSFTAIDGNKYTISELLQQKEAVVLNFWFVGCHYCMDEFPALQAAYEQYSDKVEVLALDVENDRESEIRGVINEFGLTFPVAKVDPMLLASMGAGGCPTTVVIDRYGMITYIHTGDLTDPALFPALMRHHSEEGYTQAVCKNAADLVLEQDIPYGCQWYPYPVGALSEYTGEVRANELVYYTFYRIADAILRIEDPDVYVVYNEQTYYPENGVLEMVFHSADVDSYMGATIALGTTGGEDKSVVIYQTPKPGTSGNPYQLNLGEFEIPLNGNFADYVFTAEHTGTLTITMDALPEGAFCRVNMTNLRTYAIAEMTTEDGPNAETGKYTVSIAVEAGDTVRLVIGTYGENMDNSVIKALASIPEVEGSGGSDEEAYHVVVTNESGTPMGAITLTVTVGTETFTYMTDENGVAELDLEPGTYSMELTVPEGYYATARYLLTPAKKDLNIVLVQARDYAVQVIVSGPVMDERISVRVYANDTMEELVYEGTLDANGEVHFTYGYIDGCVAVIDGLSGNVFVQSSYPLTGEKTVITLIRTSIGDTNASNQKYQLGDKISDFAVTTPDGVDYVLSELLAQKKAVLLTFWHTSNNASLSQLTALESIYETWSALVGVLGMNPQDTSDAVIDDFRQMANLNFPVAQCSAQWESAFHMTVYPTLVMIDRNGDICFIHSGAMLDADALSRIFTYYTADDYQTTVVENVEDLLKENSGNGTAENPYLVSRETTELTITLGAGRVAYLSFEELMPMSVEAFGADLYMILGEDIFVSSDGCVTAIVNLDPENNVLVIGNSGSQALEVRIVLTVLVAG